MDRNRKAKIIYVNVEELIDTLPTSTFTYIYIYSTYTSMYSRTHSLTYTQTHTHTHARTHAQILHHPIPYTIHHSYYFVFNCFPFCFMASNNLYETLAAVL